MVWLPLGCKEIPPAVHNTSPVCLVRDIPGNQAILGGFVLVGLAAGTKEAGKLSQLVASRCVSWAARWSLY